MSEPNPGNKVDSNAETWLTIYMTTTENATKELAAMLAGKVRQAMSNGATEEQAIQAVRELWLEAVAA